VVLVYQTRSRRLARQEAPDHAREGSRRYEDLANSFVQSVHGSLQFRLHTPRGYTFLD
jgi:hypothetical protein